MRHGRKVKKLSRTSSHRKALMRNLATALLDNESIQTTIKKAKALRPYVEKMITKARVDSISNKRLIARDIQDRDVHVKLFEDIAKRYMNRPGGYTRITRLGYRISDGTEMAVIELVPEILENTVEDGHEKIRKEEKKAKKK